MESGELLPSSPASSTTPTSSSAPSVASAVSKSSLSTGAASLSSTASPCVLESGCYNLPEDYIRWEDAWAIGPVTIACLGFMCTCIVITVFIKHNNTPLVKASGRELCYILLFGVSLSYCMTFFFIAKPSPVICALRRLGLGTSFAICYSALLTKTNCIARIFDGVKNGAQRPKFISPSSQVFICLGLILVQIVMVSVWLILETPGTRRYTLPEKRETVILKCNVKDSSMLISLTYDVVLVILCTVYAFKTRKCPENFNEAKFIGFTMYTTCIIWLASFFYPNHFSTFPPSPLAFLFFLFYFYSLKKVKDQFELNKILSYILFVSFLILIFFKFYLLTFQI